MPEPPIRLGDRGEAQSLSGQWQNASVPFLPDIEAAAGEIVAFIDRDAYADADWLYYLVTKLENKQTAAVGGPNCIPISVRRVRVSASASFRFRLTVGTKA